MLQLSSASCSKSIAVGKTLKNSTFLLRELIRRDLTSRFAGSFGGPVWALVNPLLLCLIYGFVFAVILRTPPPEGFPGGYAVFLLGGLIPWIGFQEAVLRATTSVSDQGHLVKKLVFPVELLPFASLGTALLLQGCGLAILVVWATLRGHGRVQAFVLLFALLFEVLILLGPILALAALNVFFRDLAQVLTPLMMIVFYFSPILYPESLVPPRYQAWMALNPVRDMAALFRAGIFGCAAPPLSRIALWSALFLPLAGAGAWLFRRCRPSFSDLL